MERVRFNLKWKELQALEGHLDVSEAVLDLDPR